MVWSFFSRALAHRSALVRLTTAAVVGLVVFTAAWTIAYAILPEGATRFTLGLLPALDARANGANVATTLFVWNVGFGFGVIGLASLYSVGPISLAYLAPWTWLVRFGVALGTNSFALFVPGARVPPLDLHVIFSHAVAGYPADINVVRDQVVARTFSAKGTFSYTCTVHPGMNGEIVVQ